jgi:hypothetical protein
MPPCAMTEMPHKRVPAKIAKLNNCLLVFISHTPAYYFIELEKLSMQYF